MGSDTRLGQQCDCAPTTGEAVCAGSEAEMAALRIDMGANAELVEFGFEAVVVPAKTFREP